MIPEYPEFSEVTLDMRSEIDPELKAARAGVSEFTFANLYLFRSTYSYRVSRLRDGGLVISGEDSQGEFFMCPGGLPTGELAYELFARFRCMKCVTEAQKGPLEERGLEVTPDRDNFDYLHLREEMSGLRGRRFHRKKNLVNFFNRAYGAEALPLLDERTDDAVEVLTAWAGGRDGPTDYEAAAEALEKLSILGLCGYIYYVEGGPAAYTLGEELTPDTFAVHFEKGVDGYKGLLQYVNQSFASMLPEKYRYVNREQDLGEPGLRKSKMSYRPAAFVKKYRAREGKP